jgi:hypothetical protein
MWLSTKRRVKRMAMGDTPLGRQMDGIVNDARERLVLAGAKESQLEELLKLYPLVDEAAAEETMDRGLVVKHGCQHCLHFYTSWERRGERERANSWQKLCLVYGVVPPACLHHEATISCSECGAAGLSPSSSTSAGRGRDIPLLCNTCYSA